MQHGEERGMYRTLVEKPEMKTTLGSPKRSLVDNINMDRGELGCCCVDQIGLAQDRDHRKALADAVMNLQVP
jgi:hypothetical protein